MAKQKTRMEKKFGGFIFLHTLNITAGSTLAPIGQQGDERGLFIKRWLYEKWLPWKHGALLFVYYACIFIWTQKTFADDTFKQLA